jgi:hypothetical protein
METSILTSTKKILGVSETYTAFDLDILTHINSVLSTLDQLGVGIFGGFSIEDDTSEWSELGLPQNQLGMVKTYIYLKVRLLFDPPSTSFHLESINKQIEECTWRLNNFREDVLLEEVESV